MHVVLLNQAFFPDVVATAQMGKDLADELVRRGHSVTAVASRSVYGSKGAVLPRKEEVVVAGARQPIRVHRVGFSLFGKSSIAARIADFALFYILAAVRVLTLPRADVVVCYTTPPFIALVGLLSKLFRGSRAIYWVMDLYPDLPVACGVMREDAIVTRVCEWLNRQLLQRSDVCVVLGRCMQERVLAKGVDAARVRMIPVWSDLVVQHDVHGTDEFRARWVGDARTLVMYSGNLGLGHDATTMCDAMLRLAGRDDIRFVFVGGGKRRAEVEAFAEQHNLPNVRFEGYVARERLSDSLAAADIHLISLKEGVEGIMVPSKLFGIMAVGRPSVFIGSRRSEISRVLEESRSGLTVDEGDGEALARAIVELAEDAQRCEGLGANSVSALAGKYDMATACGAWTTLLEEVAGSRTGGMGNGGAQR